MVQHTHSFYWRQIKGGWKEGEGNKWQEITGREIAGKADEKLNEFFSPYRVFAVPTLCTSFQFPLHLPFFPDLLAMDGGGVRVFCSSLPLLTVCVVVWGVVACCSLSVSILSVCLCVSVLLTESGCVSDHKHLAANARLSYTVRQISNIRRTIAVSSNSYYLIAFTFIHSSSFIFYTITNHKSKYTT